MNNSRPCYQLFAKGASVNGWAFKMRSRAIFTNKEDAERFIPEFKELCCDKEKFFEAADPEGLKITIDKLDLYDG